MRHTKEEIRQMRNARKKRKRQQKSEIKRAKIVEDAVRDVRAEADQCKSQALKYNELWKKSLKANNQLKRLFNDKTNKKVYILYICHTSSGIILIYSNIFRAFRTIFSTRGAVRPICRISYMTKSQIIINNVILKIVNIVFSGEGAVAPPLLCRP